MTFTFTEDQFVALVNESPTFRKHVIALATPESDRIPEVSYGDGTSTTVGLAESKLFIETQMGDL
jgi:hypothetical protein